jgi:putative addiction module component (TIGR02574 family)
MKSSPLPKEIRSLPVQDRVALAEQIWDSVVADEVDFSLTDSQKTELRRRVAEVRENPTAGRDWAELKSELLGE